MPNMYDNMAFDLLAVPFYGYAYWVDEVATPGGTSTVKNVIKSTTMETTPRTEQMKRFWQTVRAWMKVRISRSAFDGGEGVAFCAPTEIANQGMQGRMGEWAQNLVDITNFDTTGDVRVNDFVKFTKDANAYLFPAAITKSRAADNAILAPVGSVNAKVNFAITPKQFYEKEDAITKGLADAYTGGDQNRLLVTGVTVTASTSRRRRLTVGGGCDIKFTVLPTEEAIANNGGAAGSADTDAAALLATVNAQDMSTVQTEVNTAVKAEGGGDTFITEAPVQEEAIVSTIRVSEDTTDSQKKAGGAGGDTTGEAGLNDTHIMLIMIGTVALVAIVVGAAIVGVAVVVGIVVIKSKASEKPTKPVVVTGVTPSVVGFEMPHLNEKGTGYTSRVETGANPWHLNEKGTSRVETDANPMGRKVVQATSVF